jgi:hypothetical protein
VPYIVATGAHPAGQRASLACAQEHERDAFVDSTAFDNLARGIGRTADRRTALKGLAAGVFGLGAVRAVAVGAQDAADGPSVAACAIKGDPCFRNTDCCQGLKCDNGGDTSQEGRCKFKNNSGNKGDWCEKDKDCKSRFFCDKAPKKSKNACKRDRD